MQAAQTLRTDRHTARLWEIDTLRGIAVVLMIYFHFMWDLYTFGLTDANVLSMGWQIFARSIGSSFSFLMGISLTLAYAARPQLAPLAWRGLRIFGYGLIITLVTHFAIGPGAVIFGILHMLGLSMIAALPFLGLPGWAAALSGLLAIGVGSYLNTQFVESGWLIWLGVAQAGGPAMVDYYPFLPWFGVVLLGVAAGKLWYRDGIRRFGLPGLGDWPPLRGLQLLGRNSMLIYLLHQPLIIGTLFALGLARL